MSGAPETTEAAAERRRAALRALPALVARGRPVSLAGQRMLDVDPALAGLLPDGGLRRGTTLALTAGPGAAGSGVVSLALALTVVASQSGSWVAAVGLPALGLVTAAQMGAALDRLVLVPEVGSQWAVVVAALLESVDIVVMGLPPRVSTADARRLGARARERGAVLLTLRAPGAGAGSAPPAWPEVADVQLSVCEARWEGLGQGFGYLRSRSVEVTSGGRRAASRTRRARLWLPGPDGRIGSAPSEALVEPPASAGVGG